MQVDKKQQADELMKQAKHEHGKTVSDGAEWQRELYMQNLQPHVAIMGLWLCSNSKDFLDEEEREEDGMDGEPVAPAILQAAEAAAEQQRLQQQEQEQKQPTLLEKSAQNPTLAAQKTQDAGDVGAGSREDAALEEGAKADEAALPSNLPKPASDVAAAAPQSADAKGAAVAQAQADNESSPEKVHKASATVISGLSAGESATDTDSKMALAEPAGEAE